MASDLLKSVDNVSSGFPAESQSGGPERAGSVCSRRNVLICIVFACALLFALFSPWLALPFSGTHNTLNYWNILAKLSRIERYTGRSFVPFMLPPLTLGLALVSIAWSGRRALMLGVAGLSGVLVAGWLYASMSSVTVLGIHVNFTGILQIGFWAYAVFSLTALLVAPLGSQASPVSLAVAIAFVDQALKALVLYSLGLDGAQQVVVPGVLSFHVIQNTGAAFGLFQSLGPMLAFITVLMIYAGYRLVREERDPFLLLSLSVIMGGAVGNLVDRIFRQGVIDYIEVFPVTRFPLFNFADVMITLGTAGLLYHGLVRQRAGSESNASCTV